MAEMSSVENEKIVARVYEAAMSELHAERSVSPAQQLVHDVEHFMQEANSAASLGQYFRWASLDEIKRIAQHLRTLKLDDVAGIVSQAQSIAFPNGLPATDEEKSNATDWTPDQEEALAALFPPLEEQNGRVTNVLGAYARESGL